MSKVSRRLNMNWLAWDGTQHISINPNLFKHLSGVPITSWKHRINEKVRHKEIMAMPFFKKLVSEECRFKIWGR